MRSGLIKVCVPTTECKTIRETHYVRRPVCTTVQVPVKRIVPYTVMQSRCYTTCKMVREEHVQMVTKRWEIDSVQLDDVTLRVIRVVDLLHEKLRAGSDPARRRSKRLQDLADAASLLEAHPVLEGELTTGERATLDQLPR